MRARDVDASVPQQRQRLRTVSMRQHQLNSGGLHVARQDRNRGIASGDQNAIAKIFVGMEQREP